MSENRSCSPVDGADRHVRPPRSEGVGRESSSPRVSEIGAHDGVVRSMRNNASTEIGLDRGAPWMDAEEVAAVMGTTAHTMRRLAREGRSPALVRQVGNRWRWSRADVDRFVRGEARPT